jgi:hypothetical protein
MYKLFLFNPLLSSTQKIQVQMKFTNLQNTINNPNSGVQVIVDLLYLVTSLITASLTRQQKLLIKFCGFWIGV